MDINPDELLAAINDLGAGYQPFEKSDFVRDAMAPEKLCKAILEHFMVAENIINFRLTRSGQPVLKTKPTTLSKVSFCSDFSIMLKGIVGLLGFEVSRAYMYHMSTFIYASKLIGNACEASSFDEILVSVEAFNRLFRRCNSYRYDVAGMDEPCTLTRPTAFDLPMLNNSANYIEKTITDLIDRVRECKLANSVSNFEQTKIEVCNDMMELMEKIVSVTRNINTVDDLLYDAGEFSVCYTNSFLKAAEMIAVEMDQSNGGLAGLFEHFDDVIALVERDLGTYMQEYIKYFKTVVSKTAKVLTDDSSLESTISKVNLNISHTVYNDLASITITLLIKVCKAIVVDRAISIINDGKATRIQFAQIYKALLSTILPVEARIDNYGLFAAYFCLSTSRQLKAKTRSE